MGEQFRLHPSLLLYPCEVGGERKFLLETFSFQPPFVIEDFRILTAISSLSGEFSKVDAYTAWRGKSLDENLHEEIWSFLILEDLIISTSDFIKKFKKYILWEKYNWIESYVYHESTKDYPFVQMDKKNSFDIDDERMTRYISEDPIPPLFTKYKNVFSIGLKRIDNSAFDIYFKDLLKTNSHLDRLNFLFDLCFGRRGYKKFMVQGEFIKKSVPSGGARHPTEVFFALFDSSEIPCGIYHYNLLNHSLDCLKKGDFYEPFKQATFDLFDKFDKKPFGLFVFASTVERSMWRYRESRSWRAIMIDIGHLVMFYRQISAQLGYNGYTYQKFNDSEICDLIGLNPQQTLPLYAGTII